VKNKISVSTLVAMLAVKSGMTQEESELFLKEFFGLITDALHNGENVKIKALGTFKVVAVEERRSVDVSTGEDILIPEHNKIVFVPSRELAEEVNSPFSMFESVELSPDAETEIEDSIMEEETVFELEDDSEAAERAEISDLQETGDATLEEAEEEAGEFIPAEPETDSSGKAQVELEAYEVEEVESEDNVPKKVVLESEEDPKISDAGGEQVNTDKEETILKDPEDVESLEQDAEYSEPSKKSGMAKFFIGFSSGIAVALLLLFGFYFFFLKDVIAERAEKNRDQIADRKETVKKDSISNDRQTLAVSDVKAEDTTDLEGEADAEEIEAATKPSDEKVYDTIGEHRYLTTMAKDHYGNFNLWPYIYEENKGFIGHPDRIKPGTKVVIPPLSKYGVDPKNPADIKKAKRLGIEIYARYKGK